MLPRSTRMPVSLWQRPRALLLYGRPQPAWRGPWLPGRSGQTTRKETEPRRYHSLHRVGRAPRLRHSPRRSLLHALQGWRNWRSTPDSLLPCGASPVSAPAITNLQCDARLITFGMAWSRLSIPLRLSRRPTYRTVTGPSSVFLFDGGKGGTEMPWGIKNGLESGTRYSSVQYLVINSLLAMMRAPRRAGSASRKQASRRPNLADRSPLRRLT